MIAEPRRTGLLGEIYASRYLRDNGYDIIAETDNVICFVEVKTRKNGAYFDPAYAVDKNKEENVKSTAAAFLAATKCRKNIRFDIIEVVLCDKQYKIRYTENAF